MSTPTLDVTVNEYRVQQSASGALTAMRNGEPWRDCSGDGLVCGLAHEVERLRAAIKNCIDHANGRDDEWGSRAKNAFAYLRETTDPTYRSWARLDD